MVLALAALFIVGSARAQTTTGLGVEIGGLHAYDESLFQIGFRAAPTRGGFGTVDFAFATFPDALFKGVLLFLMDLDVTYGVPRDTSLVSFYPHAGVSVLTAGRVSGGGSGAAVGYNAGAGLLVQVWSRGGIRLDYTYRRLLGNDETPLSSITVGLVFKH